MRSFLFCDSNNRLSTGAAKKIGQAVGKNEGLETLLVGTSKLVEASIRLISLSGWDESNRI
jgi:hypothetical protein